MSLSDTVMYNQYYAGLDIISAQYNLYMTIIQLSLHSKRERGEDSYNIFKGDHAVTEVDTKLWSNPLCPVVKEQSNNHSHKTCQNLSRVPYALPMYIVIIIVVV